MDDYLDPSDYSDSSAYYTKHRANPLLRKEVNPMPKITALTLYHFETETGETGYIAAEILPDAVEIHSAFWPCSSSNLIKISRCGEVALNEA